MVKIAWKVINGYGPYAYLQKTVKSGGKSTSAHLAYLGAAGSNGLVPGFHVTVAPVEGFPGGRVMVPKVGKDIMDALKSKPWAKLLTMDEHAKAGTPKAKIIELLGEGAAAKGQKKTVTKPPTLVAPNKESSGKAGAPPADSLSGPIALGKLPKYANGKPVLSPGEVGQLEDVAGKGSEQLKDLINTLSSGATPAKEWAVALAGKQLLVKAMAKEGKEYSVEDGDPVPPAPPGVMVSLPVPAAPKSTKKDPNTAGPIEVSKVPVKGDGGALVSADTIKTLEKSAQGGDTVALVQVIKGLVAQQPSKAKKWAVEHMGKQLLEKVYAQKGEPQLVVIPEPPPMLIKLEPKSAVATAEVAPKSGQKTPSPKKTAAPEKPAAAEAPLVEDWTKVGPQAGSTPGGLYEDAHGVKHYVKCPGSEDHVKNELLAFDLYALAGLQVPESKATVMGRKACLASKFIEGLSGSGTNPKDLNGTLQGFVADAWLANWDSVGVGSTKYDNILGLDGKAVRVDAGGALLFHGTGGKKGDKFGTEVTELDRLRDPKVNPVAATVFGDMTLAQISDSAARVLAIDPHHIDAAVTARFGKNKEAEALTKKLLERMKYIEEWTGKKEKAQKLASLLEGKAKTLHEEPSPAEVAPNKETAVSQPAPADPAALPLSQLPKNTHGEYLVSPAGLQQLEETAALGDMNDLNAKTVALVQEQNTKEEKWAYAYVGKLLAEKLYAKEGQTVTVPMGAPPAGVKVAPGFNTSLELYHMPKDAQGKFLVTAATLKKLQGEADKGDLKNLEVMTIGMSQQQKTEAKKWAVAYLGKLLMEQLHAKKGDPETVVALVNPPPAGVADYIEVPGLVKAPPAPVTVAPNNVKVTEVPKDNKGKALISAANVKKLEAAAKQGEEELEKTVSALCEKLLSPAKKAAVKNVAADLKGQLQGLPVLEGDGGSGMAATMDQVDDGEVKLPDQEVPSPKVVNQQIESTKNGTKDYDKDLEQVSGKKGSNEGGLFKDKHLDTLHYLKWPNGDLRAKVEGLTAMLYAHAGVPVPNIRVVDFQGKKAVMSDWIDDAQSMGIAQMKKHQDVLTGFAVDAWLANWDVVGLSADNIVKGPGDKAYRIDLGGSMLFRAQGKPKEFPVEVVELDTLVDSGVNPQASQVFGGIAERHLREGAAKLEKVNDTLIDQAVDYMDLPKTSADYPASAFGEAAKDLPRMLKDRLKARRDFIVKELLNKAAAQKATAEQLAKGSDLKPTSVQAIVAKTKGFKPGSPGTNVKWQLLETVMQNELGKTKAKDSNDTVKDHYHSWKGTTDSPTGAALRWAAGDIHGEGRREIRRLEKFLQFKAGKKKLGTHSQIMLNHAMEVGSTTEGKRLVDGLQVADKHNTAVFMLQHPGKKAVTLYRGWKPDQVKYLKLEDKKVGDTFVLDDPPIYSWSLYPSIGKSFGHGSIVTKAQVPIENILLSDIVNSTGSFTNENEVLFKGLNEAKMEVTHKS